MQSRGRYLGYLVLDVTNILLYSTSVLTKYLVGRPDHSPPVTHSLPTHCPPYFIPDKIYWEIIHFIYILTAINS